MDKTIKAKLPKARLFYVRWKSTAFRWRGQTLAYFRLANSAFVWIGPLEIGWRMPWLERSARALYPHYFEDQQHG